MARRNTTNAQALGRLGEAAALVALEYILGANGIYRPASGSLAKKGDIEVGGVVFEVKTSESLAVAIRRALRDSRKWVGVEPIACVLSSDRIEIHAPRFHQDPCDFYCAVSAMVEGRLLSIRIGECVHRLKKSRRTKRPR